MHRILVLLLICLPLMTGCKKSNPVNSDAVTTPVAPTTSAAAEKMPEPAHYVGSEECHFCHTVQFQDWLQSDHNQAMLPANNNNMRGDFSGKTLAHHQQQTKFSSDGTKFRVHTDQNSATPAELELQYTFGIFPLQQYLTALPNGRWQSLPFAWDTRAASDGGQRWFHLYNDEKITTGDPLHWRAPSHNANHMCIECHSTNFTKNYDANTDSFHSSWQETGVGCESCHGPGSQHLLWARSSDKSTFTNKGWNIALTSGALDLWQRQTPQAPAQRTSPGDDMQVERCAQCHSRRSRIDIRNDADYLLDAFMPSLLDESLYHADGQIQDEVYEYGSFLQSRMHAAGVTCSNCHNPHSGKTHVEGNGLCLQCHNSSYDSKQHHMHQPATSGSFCVDCHMPATTYMQVDARRDHSLRIPRPDLSTKFDSPNACNACHKDKTADWATNKMDQHYGGNWHKPHYGETLQQARRSQPAAYEALTSLILDTKQPAVVRATALSLLPNFPTRDYRPLLANMLGDNNALIRYGALRAAESLPPQDRKMLVPLLQDKHRSLRTEAARLLSQQILQQRPELQENDDYQRARLEYIAAQDLNRDRAPALTALAALAINEQRWEDAENLLQEAIRKEPYYVPGSINLADFYRLRARDSEAENILQNALKHAQDNAELHLAYGLWLVRNQQTQAAVQQLQQAASHSQLPYFHYVYALSLQQQGDIDGALAALDRAAKLDVYSRDVQMARVDLAHRSGQRSRAQQALKTWLQADPLDPAAAQWKTMFFADPATN